MSAIVLGMKLKPCRPEMLRDEDLPVLPEWYPLDPKPTEDRPHVAPYDDAERANMRRGAAVGHAIEGPYDGEKGQLVVKGGSPQPVLYYADGACAYELDTRDSNRHVLIYRYSPRMSLMHRKTMQAVAAIYADHGKTYADEARQGDRQDRPGGEAFGL